MIQFQNEHITVFQSALYQTTSTVVSTDDLVLVVDPAWLPAEIKEIQSFVASIQGSKPLYLLFTHGDFDHIIGYQAFPRATTIGSIGLQNHPNKQHKLQLIQDFDATHYITRSYPIAFPELHIVIDQDGQTLTVGGTTLTFWQAPGHTADGLFTLVEPLGVFIAGDYLSDFERPFIYHSAMAYEQTLRTAKTIFENRPVHILVPGHGQATESPADMQRRADMAADHLARLRQAVLADDLHALEQLGREHPFASAFTAECHRDNIRIIKQEYLTAQK